MVYRKQNSVDNVVEFKLRGNDMCNIWSVCGLENQFNVECSFFEFWRGRIKREN